MFDRLPGDAQTVIASLCCSIGPYWFTRKKRTPLRNGEEIFQAFAHMDWYMARNLLAKETYDANRRKIEAKELDLLVKQQGEIRVNHDALICDEEETKLEFDEMGKSIDRENRELIAFVGNSSENTLLYNLGLSAVSGKAYKRWPCEFPEMTLYWTGDRHDLIYWVDETEEAYHYTLEEAKTKSFFPRPMEEGSSVKFAE